MNAMKPDTSKITIGDNKKKIVQFISEVILAPRATIMRWSKTTNQTPNLKIGYPGQHFASLVLGMPGTATGARGNDIADGTEVKSCSRVDQMDKCKDCKANVMRIQTKCPECGSSNIKRNNDSKWLIGVRSQDELDMYLHRIPRMFFLLSDYPNFEDGDYDTLRFTSFEIWNQSDRAKAFQQILIDYYKNIYLAHIAADPESTPAPKNFWPYEYQFYLCNPIKTFECIIENANSAKPGIEITHYIEPDADRSDLPSENLPMKLLKPDEKTILANNGISFDKNGFLNEQEKSLLPLRDTSKAKTIKKAYQRKEV